MYSAGARVSLVCLLIDWLTGTASWLCWKRFSKDRVWLGRSECRHQLVESVTAVICDTVQVAVSHCFVSQFTSEIPAWKCVRLLTAGCVLTQHKYVKDLFASEQRTAFLYVFFFLALPLELWHCWLGSRNGKLMLVHSPYWGPGLDQIGSQSMLVLWLWRCSWSFAHLTAPPHSPLSVAAVKWFDIPVLTHLVWWGWWWWWLSWCCLRWLWVRLTEHFVQYVDIWYSHDAVLM